MKRKTFILGLMAVITFMLGIWLLISPTLDRHNDFEKQKELLDNIMSDIQYDNTFAGAMSLQAISLLPTLANHDLELFPAIIPQPLDYSEFPQSIVGIGILSIDTIDLRLPVMEGIDEAGLKVAVGHVPQTASIGEIGNAVIAGHRNLTFGSMFNRLEEMELGNIIEFQALNGVVMAFEVFEILEIFPCDQIAFIQPPDKSIITLYTCTPGATHRLLIRAKKI